MQRAEGCYLLHGGEVDLPALDPIRRVLGVLDRQRLGSLVARLRRAAQPDVARAPHDHEERHGDRLERDSLERHLVHPWSALRLAGGESLLDHPSRLVDQRRNIGGHLHLLSLLDARKVVVHEPIADPADRLPGVVVRLAVAFDQASS